MIDVCVGRFCHKCVCGVCPNFELFCTVCYRSFDSEVRCLFEELFDLRSKVVGGGGNESPHSYGLLEEL